MRAQHVLSYHILGYVTVVIQLSVRFKVNRDRILIAEHYVTFCRDQDPSVFCRNSFLPCPYIRGA